MNYTEVQTFIVVIVDSGIIMAVNVFGLFDEAEQFIADYFNSEDEMQKYGRTQKLLKGPMTDAWIGRNPYLSITITESLLRIR